MYINLLAASGPLEVFTLHILRQLVKKRTATTRCWWWRIVLHANEGFTVVQEICIAKKQLFLWMDVFCYMVYQCTCWQTTARSLWVQVRKRKARFSGTKKFATTSYHREQVDKQTNIIGRELADYDLLCQHLIKPRTYMHSCWHMPTRLRALINKFDDFQLGTMSTYSFSSSNWCP